MLLNTGKKKKKTENHNNTFFQFLWLNLLQQQLENITHTSILNVVFLKALVLKNAFEVS